MVHSDCGPLEMELPYHAPPGHTRTHTHTYTHARVLAHMQTHEKNHLSAALERERSQAPGPQCPPTQLPHFLRDKSCRRLGAHKSLKQTCKSNSTIYPRKGLFKLTRRGRNQATKPALSSEVNLWPQGLQGGDLWPPPCALLSRLLAYPRPELFTAQHPSQTW